MAITKTIPRNGSFWITVSSGQWLAQACAVQLATHNRAFTLFATHYFELTDLATQYDGIANVHLDAIEYGDELVFMHAVKEGPANRSFGLHVAAIRSS